MSMRLRTRSAAVIAGVMVATVLGPAAVHAVPGVPSPLFDPNSVSWLSLRDQTSAQFAASFATNSGNGNLIADLDIDTTGGAYRVGSVWQRNIDNRGWQERRDLTAQGYANWWHRYADLGYRLVAFNKYDTAGGVRFSGVWRQNEDNRPNWTLRAAVDARVQSELDTTAVPGIAVAVFHNGTARYTRGFGFADINDNEWMDSEHVGSLGSVSKAVGGVLTLRMVEQNLIDLGDDSRDWVPSMPTHHTHTIGDLIANRGCIGDYDDIDTTGFDNMPYATALDAAEQFWDEPLFCTPPTYHYSSLGYTIAGAVLEAAGGDDIESLVRNKLTTPYGLGTLAPQDLSDSSVRRMTCYTDGNAEITVENKEWKILGGGIDSNVYDLGRFGAKLAAGQILTQASLDTMWTPPDGGSGYAYGWSTGTESGHQVVAKDGSWTGNLAYLRIYPDDQIVVAVMMNDRSGSQSAVQLGRDLGAIVLDSLP